jgi:uncharacterized protein
MTQSAKVQEPSMEEILASIRRIIADDEAKPAANDKPSSPAPAPVPAKPEKAAAAPVPKAPEAVAPKAAPAAPKPAPMPPTPAPAPRATPAPAESNSQHDIDALLNGLDEATTPEEIRSPLAEDVLELTDEMVLPSPPPPPFQKVEPTDDLEFTETKAAVPRQPAFEQAMSESAAASQRILSRSTVSEMLRPMLKSWLDDNLPGLVERIVKTEIERVSRGR